MASTSRTVKVRFDGDSQGLRRAANDGGQAVDGWRDKLARVNQAAVGASLAVGAAFLAAGRSAIMAASDLEQSFGGVDAVFKGGAAAVKQWAQDTTDNIRLPAAETGKFATLLGSQLKNAGVPMDQLGGKTKEMVQQAADLAAQFGGPTSDAVEALSAGLRGEFDSLDKYGLAINQSTINAKKAEMGLSGLTGEADRNANMMAYLALVQEQGADAWGASARESKTFAAQMESLKEQATNASAALGTALMPAIMALTGFIQAAIPWMQENKNLVAGIAITIGGLAAAVLAVNAAYHVWQAGLLAWKGIMALATAAQWLWNAAMMANPIGLVIAAIVALVAIFIYAWQNCETFRNIIIGAWNAIKNASAVVWGWITGFIRGTIDTIRGIIGWFGGLGGMFAGWVGAAKDWIVRKFNEAVDWVRGLPGRILGALGNLGGLLVGAGRAVVDGLWRGISNGWSWLTGQVSGLARRLLDSAKSALGIGSPSKLFRDEIGKWIPEGVAVGITTNTDAVRDAVARLVAAASSALPALPDVVKLGSVPRETWDRLLAEGWRGRAGDHMEALYRPETNVTVILDGEPIKATIRKEMSEGNRALKRGVLAGAGAF